MTRVIVERSLEPPLQPEQIAEVVKAARSCLDLYRIDWIESYLSLDGTRMVCEFNAPDTETARTAIRQSGTDLDGAWPATQHLGGSGDPQPNVMVSRTFVDPVEVSDIQAIEDAASHCLDIRHVRFVKTFFSSDRKRMMCLYHAPDAESVRNAQLEANMPVESIWPCRQLIPADFQ